MATIRPREKSWLQIVGDCKNGGNPRYIGQKGQLVRDAKDFQPFKIKFADGNSAWFCEKDVVKCIAPSDEKPVSGSSTRPEIMIPVRIFLSGQQIARTIGKNGISIRELREESGAEIDILDNQLPAAYLDGGDERILHFMGTLAQAEKAVPDILRLAIGEDHRLAVDLMIPEVSCSYLKGDGGARLSAIADETGCDLCVVDEPVRGGLFQFRRLQISASSRIPAAPIDPLQALPFLELRRLSLACARIHELLVDHVMAGGLDEQHFDVKSSGVSGAIHAYREQRRLREEAEQRLHASGVVAPPNQPQLPSEPGRDFTGSVVDTQRQESGARELSSSIAPVPGSMSSRSDRASPGPALPAVPERGSDPLRSACALVTTAAATPALPDAKALQNVQSTMGTETANFDTTVLAAARSQPSHALLPAQAKADYIAQSTATTVVSSGTAVPPPAISPFPAKFQQASVETKIAVGAQHEISPMCSSPELSSQVYILLPAPQAAQFHADMQVRIAQRSGAHLSATRGPSGEFILQIGGTPAANAVACYLVQEALWLNGLLSNAA